MICHVGNESVAGKSKDERWNRRDGAADKATMGAVLMVTSAWADARRAARRWVDRAA